MILVIGVRLVLLKFLNFSFEFWVFLGWLLIIDVDIFEINIIVIKNKMIINNNFFI